MQAFTAGAKVDYRVTWLEMAARPSFGWPAPPLGREGALLRAEAPPVWYFLALYDAVGRDHAWTDIHKREHDDIAQWLNDPAVELWTYLAKGWPQGFFLLDWREAGVCDLAYFGLVPEAVGQGLGKFLLQSAILTGWQRAGVRKMSVNTCTLDHPRALIQYQRFGFAPVRTEVHSRILTRDQVFLQPLL